MVNNSLIIARIYQILNIILALNITQDQICSLKCKLIVFFLKEKIDDDDSII